MKVFKWILSIMFLLMTIVSVYYLTKPSMAPELTVRELPMLESARIEKEADFLERRVRDSLSDLQVEAKAAILMDADTGYILYESNIEQSFPVASMSKIMTELLVMEEIQQGKLDWGQSVPLSAYARVISTTPGLASVYLDENQTYTVKDLFDAMAIHSANDAAIALAELVAGSEKDFVIMMNEKAKQWNLANSHFVNSSGLNNQDLGDYFSSGSKDESNQMSAKDVAMLARGLIAQYPEILPITSRASFTLGQNQYANTNQMLPEMDHPHVMFEGVDGLKTGFTDEAGYCFVGTVKRKDTRLISVVMGTDSIEARFSETKRLYDAAFQQLDSK